MNNWRIILLDDGSQWVTDGVNGFDPNAYVKAQKLLMRAIDRLQNYVADEGRMDIAAFLRESAMDSVDRGERATLPPYGC